MRLVLEAARDEPKHLELARRQVGVGRRRAAPLGQELRRDGRVEHRLAAVRRADRRDDVARGGVLQQEAARTRVDRLHRRRSSAIARQHDDAGLRPHLGDPAQRLDPVHVGHDDVHQDHVRRQAARPASVRRRRPPPRRPPRSPPASRAARAGPAARPDGRRRGARGSPASRVLPAPRPVPRGRDAQRTVVPAPVCERTSSSASSSAARSAIDVSPRWRPRRAFASGSKPMPSSATSSSITSSWSDRRTSTVAAPAWRTALASASCAIRSTWRLAPARSTGSGGGV